MLPSYIAKQIVGITSQTGMSGDIWVFRDSTRRVETGVLTRDEKCSCHTLEEQALIWGYVEKHLLLLLFTLLS